MKQLCLVLCEVDDTQPEQLRLLHRLDLPALDPQQLTPEHALDQLEAGAIATGQEITRQLLLHHWQQLDQQCAADAQRLSPPRDLAGGRP
jgi:hypothetical protein